MWIGITSRVSFALGNASFLGPFSACCQTTALSSKAEGRSSLELESCGAAFGGSSEEKLLASTEKHLDDEKISRWYTYPKTPKMNAHAERFNRTVQEEFLDYHEDLLFSDTQAFNQGNRI